jgi:DNA topoisomerase I
VRRSSDHDVGIIRRRNGRGFLYRGAGNNPITDLVVLERIRHLAVPPAWTDVWICADPSGHLQATGRDHRQRKQYLYHPAFSASQERRKFGRVVPFGRALPSLRRRVKRDLERRGLPRDKVLAALVRLLDLTALRIGGDAYARTNRTFGVTTLERRHVRVEGDRVRLVFRGKGAQMRRVEVRDRALARVVRRCRAAGPGRVFRFRDPDKRWHDVHAADLNAYVREHTDDLCTAKDFRTWAGTVAAVDVLAASSNPSRGRRALVTKAVLAAADRLGDTVTVTRRSYVHPNVLAVAPTVDLEGTARPRERGLRDSEAVTLNMLTAGQPAG